MNPSDNAVADAIDGAIGDWTMSGDAMRWSPEVAERAAGSRGGPLPGVEAAAGIGAGLGIEVDTVRRLVTGALDSLSAVATDVVNELRQLGRGTDDDRG